MPGIRDNVQSAARYVQAALITVAGVVGYSAGVYRKDGVTDVSEGVVGDHFKGAEAIAVGSVAVGAAAGVVIGVARAGYAMASGEGVSTAGRVLAAETTKGLIGGGTFAAAVLAGGAMREADEQTGPQVAAYVAAVGGSTVAGIIGYGAAKAIEGEGAHAAGVQARRAAAPAYLQV